MSTQSIPTDHYDSAAESLDNFITNPHYETEYSSSSENIPSISEGNKTSGIKNKQIELNRNTESDLYLAKDYTGADDDSVFHHNLTRNKTSQGVREELFDEELERVVTQLSRISRSLTHQSQKENIKAESNEEEDDDDDDDEEGYDPRKMDWDGPDDSGNPFNWPSWKKWYCTLIIGFLCLVITLGSSIYVNAIPEMQLKWKISQTLGLSGLSFYLLGLAGGPVIAAPISELFGRKVVYCSTLPISMLFIMGVGLSKHIRETLVLRFFAGFTASAALAIGGGSITDIWQPNELGLAMTIFSISPLAGPVVGPIIGGFAAEHYVSDDPNKIGGLRWTMWINLFFAASALIPIFLMPETYKVIILKARMKKRGMKIKKSNMTFSQFLLLICFITILKPIEMLFVEPIVLVFSIYTAFIFAVLFGFFEAFPVIFSGEYSMSLGVSGLPFLGVGIGLLLGALTYLYIDKRIFFKKHKDGYIGMKDKDGKPTEATPESRLLPCKIGSLTLAPSLFWLGWTGRSSIHWMCPVAAGIPFGFSLILIFFSVLTYFSMVYPPLSVASALAANNLLRYVVSSVFPLFTVQMLDNLGIGWGVSVFAFIAVTLIPVPWIFDRFGGVLRTRSKYGFVALLRQEAVKAKGNEV